MLLLDHATSWHLEAWFTRELNYKHKPQPIPDPLHLDHLPPFDAAPLALTQGEGRLILPEGFLGRFETLEPTAAMVSEFKAFWYEKFTQGKISMATVKSALLGNCSTAPSGTTATPVGPPPPKTDADDPTNEEDLQKIPLAGASLSELATKHNDTIHAKKMSTVQLQCSPVVI